MLWLPHVKHKLMQFLHLRFSHCSFRFSKYLDFRAGWTSVQQSPTWTYSFALLKFFFACIWNVIFDYTRKKWLLTSISYMDIENIWTTKVSISKLLWSWMKANNQNGWKSTYSRDSSFKYADWLEQYEPMIVKEHETASLVSSETDTNKARKVKILTAKLSGELF